MMPQLKPKVHSRLDVRPVLKILVIAQAASEVVSNLNGTDEDVEIVQKGVLNKYLKCVTVYGLGHDGHIDDEVTIDLKCENYEGDIELDLSDGSSAIDALDKGFGDAVLYARRRFERRGLSTRVDFTFRDEIYNDPDLYARVQRELGTRPVTPPEWKSGYEPREVLNIRPGKSKDLLTSFRQSFKKRG